MTTHALASAAAAPAVNAGDLEIEAAIRSIGIPSAPHVLLRLRQETARDEPDLRKVGELLQQDVALAAALLKAANSPLFGGRGRVGSVTAALSLLGLNRVGAIVQGLLLRQAVGDGPSMERFWDSSFKRAAIAGALSRELPMPVGLTRDEVYTFGLFQDAGIGLLMQRFADYRETLALANADAVDGFTGIENARHNTNHALVGGFIARSWGLPEPMVAAIRLHHDYGVLTQPTAASLEAATLVAIGLVAEQALQQVTGRARTCEWSKGGAAALQFLGLDEGSFLELKDMASDLLADID